MGLTQYDDYRTIRRLSDRSSSAGAATLHGPVYLLMHRVNKPILMTAVQTDFQISKGQLLREGDDAVIFACWYMVADVLSTAETIEGAGIAVAVANMHSQAV